MATELTIGKLADAAGVNVETIRYYQRRGLLDEPAKPLGGHRRYPVDMVKRLRFIKRAQALGFTLSEVGGLLTLDESCACAETRARAARKLALIEQKMALRVPSPVRWNAADSSPGAGRRAPLALLPLP